MVKIGKDKRVILSEKEEEIFNKIFEIFKEMGNKNKK
jgi:uncharacterized protein YlzI (FlbEa/FlbD family)